MRYIEIDFDCVHHQISVPVIIRKTDKQQLRLLMLADEEPTGDQWYALLLVGGGE